MAPGGAEGGKKRGMKVLPPTLREKKRYVLFRLFAGKPLSKNAVSGSLWDAFLSLYGVAGTAALSLWLVDFDARVNGGILRCRREGLEQVKAGLLVWGEVNRMPVVPRLLKISGTIKTVKEALLRLKTA